MNATSKYLMKIILFLSYFYFQTDAARVLGIFPIAGRSHFTCNHAIMKSLHDAGHHITMITPFPNEEKMENFTYVNSHFEDSMVLVGSTTIEKFAGMSLKNTIEFLMHMEIKYCYEVMKLKEIQETLNSPEKLYDVMFVEILTGHECYLPIAEKLGIPIIGTVTVPTLKSADNLFGVPHSPVLIPMGVVSTGLEMTFFERMKNLWHNSVFEYYHKIKIPEKLRRFYREHFGEEEVPKKGMSLVFYNNHPTLLSRPMPPNVIEVGGIHLKPSNALPKDLQKFIDEASHGVVLFTFGSVVRASSLPSEQRQAFLAAFATIPQRVIWKYEEPIENLPENVMLSSWLPQRDILEHKKVIAFMSHCGQSGSYEAVVTGTPVVAIPLFGDQSPNAVKLKRQEVAVIIDLKTVTKEKVLDALNTIINDTGYYQRMQALSRAFKDRPMSPQESVVYWTEYVVRHNGTQYFKTLGADMPFYKYFMIDIAALVFTAVFFISYIIFKTVRYFNNILFRSSSMHAVSEKKLK